MAEPTPSFHWRAERDATALAGLPAWTDHVVTGLALKGRLAYALRLCLEEAVANLVMHATPRPDRNSGDIDLVVERSGDQCVLTIIDRCIPFDPRTAAQPAHDPDRIGGAGIGLLHHFADAVEYEVQPDANCLTIRLNAPDDRL